jgi:two-component system chemotaxis response regulator CheY
VVDDEHSSRVATHHALRALGCRLIDEASQGASALHLLAGQQYDLVISNWRLRSMSGGELLHFIRHTPQLAALPVVIATPVTPEIVAEAVLQLFLGREEPPERRSFLS